MKRWYAVYLTLYASIALIGFVYYINRNDKQNSPPLASNSAPLVYSENGKSSPEVDPKVLRVAEEAIERATEPPDLVDSTKGWDGDAKFEIDRISKESFSQTLSNTCDFKQNYFRMIMDTYYYSPGQADNLKMIVLSRRFVKLVEEMNNGGPSREQINDLLVQLRSDINKLRVMKEADPEASRSIVFGTNIDDPNVKDQSDLPGALGYRMNASEVLIGQFAIHEGLPLLLESLDTRDGTFLKNWTSVAYSCDKILSAEPRMDITKEQRQIREEYLNWKDSVPEVPSEESSGLNFTCKSYFIYERTIVPSFRSPRQPYERAAAMGAPLDSSEGSVTIEIPPCLMDGVETAVMNPKPQTDIVAFARRYQEAG